MKQATYILLDRSGSMQQSWLEMTAALEGAMKAIGVDEATRKSKTTMMVFDTGVDPNSKCQVVIDKIKAKDVKMTEALHGIGPRGGTPLFDAMGVLDGEIAKQDPKAAAILIITDGEENSSQEINKDGAKAIMDRWQKKGFDVSFLGASFDAFGQAGDLGVRAGKVLNSEVGAYGGAAMAWANNTRAFAATGKSVDYTEEDRKTAKGE